MGAGKEGARTSFVERDGVGGQELMGLGTSTLHKSSGVSPRRRLEHGKRKGDMSVT